MVLMSDSVANDPHLLTAPSSSAAGPYPKDIWVTCLQKTSKIKRNGGVMMCSIHCAFSARFQPEWIHSVQLHCWISLADTTVWAGGPRALVSGRKNWQHFVYFVPDAFSCELSGQVCFDAGLRHRKESWDGGGKKQAMWLCSCYSSFTGSVGYLFFK